MHKISNTELRKRIEPLLHEFIQERTYQVEILRADDLLTYNRFDIAAKLLYLDGVEAGSGTFDDVYRDHIRAFTFGKFREPGNDQKRGPDRFADTFTKLYFDLSATGFREDVSIIPLANDGSILNGAHRVASAIALGLPVPCVRLDVPPLPYDYSYFRTRAMPDEFLDLCALRFVQAASNCFFAVVWPAATGYQDELCRIIPRIIYQNEVTLSLNGLHNFIATVYSGEAWLGDKRANYPGASGKLVPCFAQNRPLRFFVFQANDLNEVQSVKHKVRDLFQMDKNSVHTNNDKTEALTIAHSLLNQNALHFLNHARPNRFSSTSEKIDIFRKWCSHNKLRLADTVLDSGMVLSVYGIRETADIDYLSTSAANIIVPFPNIESHHDVLHLHGATCSTLVNDPRFHFRFEDVKFVSFAQLVRMKSRRNDKKDRNDVAMMQVLIERKFLKLLRARAQQKVLYAKVRMYSWIRKTLRSMGLLEVARSIYKVIVR